MKLIRLIVIFLAGLNAGITLAQPNLPSPVPDRIILNATPDPLHAVAVTWRTDTTVREAVCELQPLSGGRLIPENTKTFAAKTTRYHYAYENEPVITVHQHAVMLGGLHPGSGYLYRVGSPDGWSEWFEFHTPPSDDPDFSFVYFGDPQTSLKSEWSRVVRRAYRECADCRFMLYGGDIINRAGRDLEWDEWFEAGSFVFSTIPQILTPGNHDYRDEELGKHWNAQFSQPQNGPAGLKGTCFFVDYPRLRLISIDSAAGSELEEENGYPLQVQKAWLDSVLATNTKEWVVLTTHLPFYSTKDNRDNPLLRKHFQPILEKYKVDLVLTGHDHSYGRGRVSDNPSVKPAVVYVVSVSGPKLYPEGTKSWMERKGGNLQLYQIISLKKNELLYQAYTADGKLFDSFSVRQKENGQKEFHEMKPE